MYNLNLAVIQLQAGKSIRLRPRGNSMTPIIKSGETVTLVPFDGELQKNDVVLAKVKGRLYLHKVSAIQGNRVQISNNHGHVNGWTTKEKIYGKLA